MKKLPLRPVKGKLLKDTVYSAEWLLKLYDALREAQEALFPNGDRRRSGKTAVGGGGGAFYSAKLTAEGGTGGTATADIYDTADAGGDPTEEGVTLHIVGGLDDSLPSGTVIFPVVQSSVSDGGGGTETAWVGTWQGIFV